jgi:hypothetical protein
LSVKELTGYGVATIASPLIMLPLPSVEGIITAQLGKRYDQQVSRWSNSEEVEHNPTIAMREVVQPNKKDIMKLR